jgi:hypothetical protein
MTVIIQEQRLKKKYKTQYSEASILEGSALANPTNRGWEILKKSLCTEEGHFCLCHSSLNNVVLTLYITFILH